MSSHGGQWITRHRRASRKTTQSSGLTSDDANRISKILEYTSTSKNKSLTKFLDRVLHSFPELRSYRIVKLAGAGINGIVLRIEKSTTTMMLKIWRHGRHEATVQSTFAQFALAPAVHFVGHLRRGAIEKDSISLHLLGMEVMDTTLEREFNRYRFSQHELERMVQEAFQLIEAAYQHNLTHGDSHWDNIALSSSSSSSSSSPKYKFLDFGDAVVFPPGTRPISTLMDMLHLLRSAKPDKEGCFQGQEIPRYVIENWRMVERITKDEIIRRFPKTRSIVDSGTLREQEYRQLRDEFQRLAGFRK